jgi:cellulose synthase/poly-beta-1,6-N-acetylglucosamine synthase-like glycosyltransferase
MNNILPIFIPCRNESKNIENTINSIYKAGEYANIIVKIIVVNDGSKDNTSEIAKNLKCEVIDLKDRGYSALGKPELAITHNYGYKFIVENYPNSKYLMVIGGDTILASDYIKILIEELDKNENIVITAGILKGRNNVAPNAVTGSGRIIRMSFWNEFGNQLPTIHHAWESYPIFYANSKGYKTKTFNKAVFTTQRPPLAIVNWFHYGLAMRETGALFIYCLLRSLRQILKGNLKNGVRLIKGYIFGEAVMYPKALQDYVKQYQRNRIINFFKFKYEK